MISLINKIKNLALIPIIVGSLNSCKKEYNFDGETVKYNKSLADPLEVRTNDSVFVYSVSNLNDSINAVYTYPCSKKTGCKISEGKIYRKFGEGKEKINEYQKRFTNYSNKINLIENKQ